MTATLYAVPASHPCATVERALELKGIPFRRVDLVPVFHKLHQKARFRVGSTVPGLVLADGRRILGSREILAALDQLVPEPPLLPADPDARRRVEQCAEWGEGTLQPLARRVIWWALGEAPAAQRSYIEGARLFPPIPHALAGVTARPVAFLERRFNAANAPDVRADLQNLPRHLDRIGTWLEEGCVGGETPNAADLHITPSLAMMMTLADLAPLFDGPVGEYARRAHPSYPGHTPAGALPAEWLPAAADA